MHFIRQMNAQHQIVSCGKHCVYLGLFHTLQILHGHCMLLYILNCRRATCGFAVLEQLRLTMTKLLLQHQSQGRALLTNSHSTCESQTSVWIWFAMIGILANLLLMKGAACQRQTGHMYACMAFLCCNRYSPHGGKEEPGAYCPFPGTHAMSSTFNAFMIAICVLSGAGMCCRWAATSCLQEECYR